jgi:hypothetical protein
MRKKYRTQEGTVLVGLYYNPLKVWDLLTTVRYAILWLGLCSAAAHTRRRHR